MVSGVSDSDARNASCMGTASRSFSATGCTWKSCSMVRSSAGIEPHWWLAPGWAHGPLTSR